MEIETETQLMWSQVNHIIHIYRHTKVHTHWLWSWIPYTILHISKESITVLYYMDLWALNISVKATGLLAYQ